MPSKNKPEDTGADAPSPKDAGPNAEDVLKPFQDAAAKFQQANYAAQEAAIKQRAQACLNFQDEVRKVEQDAFNAIMEANRKQIGKIGQQETGSTEELYSARVQTQFDYEKEIRQVCADAQTRLKAVVEKACSDE